MIHKAKRLVCEVGIIQRVKIESTHNELSIATQPETISDIS